MAQKGDGAMDAMRDGPNKAMDAMLCVLRAFAVINNVICDESENGACDGIRVIHKNPRSSASKVIALM